MCRTKIVATIGPASSDKKTIGKLLDAGMNVARINFSHGDRDSATELVNKLRRVAAKKKVPLAILGDLQGPKLRLGEVPNNSIEVVIGDQVTLTAEAKPDSIAFPHEELYAAIKPEAMVILGDGEVQLKVISNDGISIVCEVIVSGEIKSRKGVNLPGTEIPLPSITEKDKVDLGTICELEMDYVALSFVRSASDIIELRELMHQHGADIPIIAKIEKKEAVDNLMEIREVTNGMMVARGDLGIDLPPHHIPFLQKKIIRACNEVGIPVITATQMLQSMVENPIPTRAEATDVANAILDGTDAVMLSAETASGSYPAQSVEMMHNIASITEENFPYGDWEIRRRAMLDKMHENVAESISMASCGIGFRLGAKAIVTNTVSGYTARQVARFRPKPPIIALSPKESTQRRLALVWGVRTIHVPRFGSMDEMVEDTASTVATSSPDQFDIGDTIVITAGVPFGRTGLTNLLQVHTFVDEDFE